MDAHPCRCPGRFFAEAEVALVALILLSKCMALPKSTEAGKRLSQQRAEALAGSGACHQLESQTPLCSGAYGLHDSSSSIRNMQHSRSYTRALYQDDQIRDSHFATVAHAGEDMCAVNLGEASDSEAGCTSTKQGGQSSRYECCAHEQGCRQ